MIERKIMPRFIKLSAPLIRTSAGLVYLTKHITNTLLISHLKKANSHQLTAISYMALSLFLFSCNNGEQEFDASGSFEAEETIISAEATGTILQLDIEEGKVLQKGEMVGYIDSTQLFLKKKQLLAQLKATGSRKPNISAQTGYFGQQEAATQTRLNNLMKEQKRLQNLVNANAATPKQLDDMDAQIEEVQKQLQVIRSQKEAQVSALQTQSSALSSDMLPLEVQIDQINDQLAKCKIVNPLQGTVLTQYAEPNEMTAMGKPLYKIADLSMITLRAYITGDQLPQVKLNQKVTVLTDDGKGGYTEKAGTITWINDKAEFTPKSIQTKDERANKVYAAKIKVPNDGTYKIGMYGEVLFSAPGQPGVAQK